MARTRREGMRRDIATDALVPGDLVLLHEGDIYPGGRGAAGGAQLSVDESALTGKSVPATKDATNPPEDRAVYADTTILAGRGFARLTTTGPRTRYGQIGSLVAGGSRRPRRSSASSAASSASSGWPRSSSASSWRCWSWRAAAQPPR
ncbi:MAG: hypothetical protein U0232_03155 [Thermomicrobiales bacterium]